MSLDNDRSDAEEAISELKDAVCVAIAALESLEGCISDAEAIDSLELHWTNRSEPDIPDILNTLGFNYGEFSVKEIIS